MGAFLFAATSAQADYYSESIDTGQVNEVNQYFTQGELAQMLAPIALYPDTLLTHILIASSYPLEVVEAYRWQKDNQSLSEQTFNNKLDRQNWDASVKALVPFERVLKQMQDDLTWMRNLGDAFLGQEQSVLDTIQELRQQAYNSGSLDDLENAKVEYDNEKIVIVPSSPKVIYVPYYDTREVYGYWRWHHYPPRYWHWDRYYYNHPVAWHAGVHIGVSFFFSAFHWHHGYVVVNHHKVHHHRKRHHIIRSGYSKRWHHKPTHRKNVAYRTATVKEKYKYKSSHSVRYNKQRNTAKLVRSSKAVTKQRTYTKLASNNAKPRKTNSYKQQSNTVKTVRPYSHNKKREVSSEKQFRKANDRQINTIKRSNSKSIHSNNNRHSYKAGNYKNQARAIGDVRANSNNKKRALPSEKHNRYANNQQVNANAKEYSHVSKKRSNSTKTSVRKSTSKTGSRSARTSSSKAKSNRSERKH